MLTNDYYRTRVGDETIGVTPADDGRTFLVYSRLANDAPAAVSVGHRTITAAVRRAKAIAADTRRARKAGRP